jgi:hypothetical protein
VHQSQIEVQEEEQIKGPKILTVRHGTIEVLIPNRIHRADSSSTPHSWHRHPIHAQGSERSRRFSLVGKQAGEAVVPYDVETVV